MQSNRSTKKRPVSGRFLTVFNLGFFLFCKFIKEGEGHGPEGAREENHDHIREETAEEGAVLSGEKTENGIAKFLHRHCGGKAQAPTEQFAPKGSFGGIVADIFLIQFINAVKTENRAQHLIGVFQGAVKFFPVGLLREGEEFHKEDLPDAPYDHNAEKDPHRCLVFKGVGHNGMEEKNQQKGDPKGNRGIQGGVYAQIHTGKGH